MEDYWPLQSTFTLAHNTHNWLSPDSAVDLPEKQEWQGMDEHGHQYRGGTENSVKQTMQNWVPSLLGQLMIWKTIF